MSEQTIGSKIAQSNEPTKYRQDARKQVSMSRIDIEYEHKLDEWERNVDKRYAWVVLMALFTIMATTLGSYRIFGLIFAKIVESKEYTREQASWPISTIFTTENCIGPIVSIMVYYISFRQSLFIGSVFLVLGNGLAYFSHSLLIDVLLIGFVQGVGYGFIFVPLMEVVNNYFVKYRTTSLGIALTGGTASVFVLAPLFNYLLNIYHYRVSYAAIGGLCCINLIMVPLLKPNPRPRSTKLSPTKDQNDISIDNSSLNRRLSMMSQRAFRFQTSLRRQMSVKYEKHPVRRSISTDPNGPNSEKSPKSKFEERRTYSLAIKSTNRSDKNHNVLATKWTSNDDTSNQLPTNPSKTTTTKKESRFNDIEASGHNESKLRADDDYFIEDNEEEAEEEEFKLGMVTDILTNPMFHLIWFNELIFFWVFGVYTLVIVDYGIDIGLAVDDAQSLLQYWSCGEIVGRLILAPMVDLKYMSNRVCVIVLLVALAAIIGAVTIATGFLYYAILSMMASAFNSLLYVLVNGLLVDYLGENKVTLGYGLAALFTGVLVSARPLALGYSRDILGSYNYIMWGMASMCLFGAVMWLFEPYLNIRKAPQKSAQGAMR